MKKRTHKALLAAAAAGLMSAALSMPAQAKKMKKDAAGNELVQCYGVNRCGGMGQCGGKTAGGKSHACGGQNACKGQGWLSMPKDSCLALEGGSVTPVASAAAPAQAK